MSAGNFGSEGVRFFLVPLGTKGRESSLSLQLAARDPYYGNLFLSDHWIELWESLAEARNRAPGLLETASPDAIGTQIVDYLVRYLQGARDSFKINIAEVFVTCSSFVDSGPSQPGASNPGHSEIVRQHTLPFISHLSFRPEDPPLRDPSAAPEGAAAVYAAGGSLSGVVAAHGAAATAAAGAAAGAGKGAGWRDASAGWGSPPAVEGGAGAWETYASVSPPLPPTSATHPLSSPPLQHAPSPLPLAPLVRAHSPSALASPAAPSSPQPMDMNLDFWVGVAGDSCKTSARGPFLDLQVRRVHQEGAPKDGGAAPTSSSSPTSSMSCMSLQAVSVCRGTSYQEKNKRIRSNVTVTEREKGGGTVIKADVNRLICYCPAKVCIACAHARILCVARVLWRCASQ